MSDNIKSILTTFLSQSKNDDLKTKHFPKMFRELSLKVSFGQGASAKIPWISFLGKNQTTSKGIYPVYLLYKKYDLLVLAYGISEENESIIKWDIDDKTKSIKDYFYEINKNADRYGTSYVYKTYDLNNPIDWNTIENDLYNLLDRYKDLIGNNILSTNMEMNWGAFDVNKTADTFKSAGYIIKYESVIRFTASLLSKPFVILTGLSGSGKTKLALAFSKWICESKEQICVVPVGADWTNREPLLGFANALEPKKYVLPENGALPMIIEANKEENSNKPYFLILDEMNLSHVERYFADFLSVMESGEPISLHADVDDWKDTIPASIKLPANLFIVGTVNIDETTYMFSPKVLDRASVIEFRVTEEEMNDYLKNKTKLNLDELKGAGADMAGSFVTIAKDKELAINDNTTINETLIAFFRELKKTGAEFGYRSASEILRFAAVANKIAPTWTDAHIIDASIMQKLLPKVHGSRRKLEPVLRALAGLCVVEGKKADEYLSGKKEIISDNEPEVKYPVSLEKIVRMYNNLLNNGFTSYAEA